mgnify:FL=1
MLFNIKYNFLKTQLNFDTDNIQINSRIEDIGINSLEFIKMIVFLEENYDFTFPDEYLLYDNFNTLEDIIDMVLKIKMVSMLNDR